MMTMDRDGPNQQRRPEGELIRHYLDEARGYLDAIGDALDKLEAQEEGNDA